MNNEIGRKITSLTLMTIMLAGGMTIAMPGVMPEAMAANANLFVSAENSQFENTITGPQVVEIVVIDSDINETNESNGEPDVTVNGAKLRMAQATDGNWYGYFADKTQATKADGTTDGAAGGYGLDFGQFCSSASTALASDETTQLFSDTVGVAIPVRSNSTTNTFGVNGTATIPACNTDLDGTTSGHVDNAGGAAVVINANSTHTMLTGNGVAAVSTGVEKTVMNVVREAKKINTITSHGNGIGQIGLKDDGLWPFIQLYDLTSNVNIQYQKGGGVQSTTLSFGSNVASWGLDRSVYPQGADVHLTISDNWLNIDPTDEDSWTFATNSTNTLQTIYQMFDENGAAAGNSGNNAINLQAIDISGGPSGNQLSALQQSKAVLQIDGNPQGKGNVLTIQDNANNVVTAEGLLTAVSGTITAGKQPVTITETGPASNVFVSYDSADKSTLKTVSTDLRGTSATIKYDGSSSSIVMGYSFGSIDIQPTDDEWSSGEVIPVVLVDADFNKNSRSDEDISVKDNSFTLIPALSTGDPFTLGEGSNSTKAVFFNGTSSGSIPLGLSVETTPGSANTVSVDSYSKVGRIPALSANAEVDGIIIDYQTTFADFRNTVKDSTSTSGLKGVNLLNIDVRALNTTGTVDVYLLNSTTDILTGAGNTLTGAVFANLIVSGIDPQSLTVLNGTAAYTTLMGEIADTTATPDANNVGLMITFGNGTNTVTTTEGITPFVADFFSFGFTNNGYTSSDRVANQIVRLELEESGDNTGEFVGSLEYVMINQLNILDASVYSGLTTISDEVTFIAIEDLTDEDSPRVNYLDLGADGVSTQIADQQAASTHSGMVSFGDSNYKVADTVTITLEDLDLNVDSSLIDIYTVVTTSGDTNYDAVGKVANSRTALSDGVSLTRLLDVTFDDEIWQESSQGTVTCGTPVSGTDGLGETGFTLVETGSDTGVFVGDFQIPANYCKRTGFTGSSGTSTSTTGVDIEVNYVDFRDASGETIEVGDGAGVRANTGSVSLDRTVYPVPFGQVADFSTNTAKSPTNADNSKRSVFPIHATGIDQTSLASGESLSNGDLTIHVRVNDPDYDLSAAGEDTIATGSAGSGAPVKVSVIRGSETVIIGYAGTTAAVDGTIDTNAAALTSVRTFGPMVEIAPDAGIFESDITIRYTDGPDSSLCPATSTFTGLNGTSLGSVLTRFDAAAASGENYCILQGDILQVEYTDPTDASGSSNTVTDSATFDLRNGVLQSDKSVYIIGSDMILTLIEPDFDLDNDGAETYDLDLIEWDSDAFTNTIGDEGGFAGTFDPEPTAFRETGDSTGIFQVVLEIPASVNSNNLERGEEIVLEYTDWGPSGSNFVGDEDEDVNVTIFTSNFGATVELDQKVYTWTDKVYITVVAPDHNFDSNLVDEIGNTSGDPLKVATRGYDIDQYKLVETGTDTGIFTGEVILTGFTHDADGDGTNDKTLGTASGTGPTDGKIPTDDDDGLTVSFEFSEDETVVGSALIRWNIGEVQWLEASYPASGTGVVRVIDPDMNLDPEAVDNFKVDAWSDSDAGGINLTVTETNEATGIFEGTVFFTVSNESSGHRLRVAEGDTVTAEYEDNTLPDPYTTADELDITATSLIGTVVPPLERAPAANLRTVDAFGNSLDTVSVDQQVQISADLANGQDREQSFAYLVQIQDGNGVTVSLAWITGSLSAGQSFSPALSWIPTQAGTYTATAFVWESVDNPTALSPPVSTTVTVQ